MSLIADLTFSADDESICDRIPSTSPDIALLFNASALIPSFAAAAAIIFSIWLSVIEITPHFNYNICVIQTNDYIYTFKESDNNLRILVMSDCHGAYHEAERVLSAHDDIKTIFYLGDGVGVIENIMEFYPDKTFHIVSGNCDWNSKYNDYGEAVINNVRIIYTHGHKLGVKYGTEQLFKLAQNVGATLVLYGHTHISSVEYRDGIYLVNPGSLRLSREGAESYAIVDISKDGIMPNIIKI